MGQSGRLVHQVSFYTLTTVLYDRGRLEPARAALLELSGRARWGQRAAHQQQPAGLREGQRPRGTPKLA